MKKYTLRVYPKGGSRVAYRVLEIGGSKTLDDLCVLILGSFHFIHEHLYEFCMDNIPYAGFRYEYQPDDGMPSTNIRLDKVILGKGQNFLFHYDYGDDWLFAVHVQKVEDVKGRVASRVIKEKGNVEQYPDWDDWDEDDEEEDEK